jgi:O-antigen/teichoic acid export membrane protein
MLNGDIKAKSDTDDARLKTHTQELFRGSAAAAISKVSITAVGFLFNLVIARSLGPSETGAFYLALAVVTITSILSRLGLDQAVLKYASRHAAKGDHSSVKGIYLQALTIVTLSSAGFSLVLIFIGPWLAEEVFNKPALTTALRYMAFGILPLAVLTLHGQFLKAIKYVGLGLFFQNAAISAICLVFILCINSVKNAEMLTIFYLAATITACCFIFILWFSVSKSHAKDVTTDNSVAQRLVPNSYFYGISIVNQVLLPWTAVVCLGVWASEAELGQFVIARRVAVLINFAYLAVESITGPKFSVLFDQNDILAVQHVANRATIMMFAAAAPLGLLFFIAPAWVMGWFGEGFRLGSTLLTILAIGQLINVATGSVANLLIMSGNEKSFRNISFAAGACNIILCATFIPLYGAIGAAVATTVSIAVLNLFATFVVWQRLGFIPFPGLHSRTGNP